MEEKYQHLLELLGEISDINEAAGLLGWDQQTYMPPGAAESRSHQMATLNRLAHDKFVSDEIGRLLSDLKPQVADMDPDSNPARMVKQVGRRPICSGLCASEEHIAAARPNPSGSVPVTVSTRSKVKPSGTNPS